MQLLVRSTVCLGAVLLSGPVFAADRTEYRITGSLDRACSVSAPDNQTIDPASTAVQPAGSPTYQCNFIGNASLRFWTLNGGVLVSPASSTNGNAAQSRIYTFVFDGSTLGQLTDGASSATPVVRAIAAVNTARTGAVTIQLAAPATVAGSYSDTVFVSIAP